MPVGQFCLREVIICDRNTPIRDVAKLMRRHHVGDLLVVDDVEGKRVPVGIVTDRDIAVSVLALDLDPTVISAGDILSREIVTVREDQGLFDTMQLMRVHGIRRMPVVDDQGALVGIISVDDLIQLFAEEMSELAKLISKEQAQEAQQKRWSVSETTGAALTTKG